MEGDAKDDYDRIGLEIKKKKILGTEIQRVVLPLTPGKHISVIAEVIATNYLLSLRGVIPAKEYDVELRRVLSQMETPSVHYDEDLE